jgi:hypothetical protein
LERKSDGDKDVEQNLIAYTKAKIIQIKKDPMKMLFLTERPDATQNTKSKCNKFTKLWLPQKAPRHPSWPSRLELAQLVQDQCSPSRQRRIQTSKATSFLFLSW